jgi:hypothetical protein
MLTLDFIHVRLNDPVTQPATDLLRTADSYKLEASPEEIREIVSEWIQGDFVRTPQTLRTRLGNKDVSLFPIPLGLQGEFGLMTVASDRLDFPRQTESLLLSVAANQVSIGLGEQGSSASRNGLRTNSSNGLRSELLALPRPMKN